MNPGFPRTVLEGRAGSPGFGVGWTLAVDIGSSSDPPGRDAVEARSPEAEQDRLRSALAEAAAELEGLAVQTAATAGEEVGAIFEAQALFARDPGIVEPALDRVAAGQGAVTAILESVDVQADALAALDDEYFRERAADVRDVGRRVAAILDGQPRPDLWHPDGRPAVLVGTDLDPSMVAVLRPELVVGIALAGGAPTGHAAIVARALGIPLVLGLGAAVATLDEPTEVAVDGTRGRVIVHPVVEDTIADESPEPAAVIEALDLHGVSVVANVASASEAAAAAMAGAQGIGLVRTELLFLGRSRAPSVAEQRATYARILASMGGRPVVFRTLDIGGDKPAAWRTEAPEPNPALGVRGVRLGQRETHLLDDQLAALIGAAASHRLRVMLPMISTVEEVVDVRERLDGLLDRMADADGTRPLVDLGIMIEVPAAAIMADRLAEVADFFSIGTNDLVQYTLAADRTNHELADLGSVLQPAVLRLIDGVVRAAAGQGRHVAVCGEAAADPLALPLLVGMGVRELSVSPAAIPGVRRAVANLDLAACAAIADRARSARTLADVRALVAGGQGG